MKFKAFLSAVLACLTLCACGRTEISRNDITAWPSDYDKEAPLICTAESREEAEAVAGQYGITLVEYSYGVATFYTEENPNAVIQRGIEQGWTELSLNLITKLD